MPSSIVLHGRQKEMMAITRLPRSTMAIPRKVDITVDYEFFNGERHSPTGLFRQENRAIMSIGDELAITMEEQKT